MRISTNWMKLTETRIGVAAFAAALALALPAQADDKVSQADFVLDSNTTTGADFGGGFSGDGNGTTTGIGTVTVPEGNQLEVFNFLGIQGVITVDCIVTLSGEDSELNLAEGTDLLFFCAAGDACETGANPAGFKNFTITAAGAGSEIEIQVKKNSIIEAENFTCDIDGAEEAEAQFEENFCLRLHGSLNLSMSLTSDEGGDVQFKKFDSLSVVRPAGFRVVGGVPGTVFTDGACGASPNIRVDGDILLSVGDPAPPPGLVQGDAEIQIEEGNHLEAGGDILINGYGLKSQLQSKKDVTLHALGGFMDADGLRPGDITLSALGDFSEVQAEENNTYTAGVAAGSILLATGIDGKLEVKKGSVFTAGGGITISPGAGTSCKIEASTGAWSPTPPTVTGDCDVAP